MKQSTFDKWLTTQPEPDTMLLLTREEMTDDVEGLSNPRCIDELSCEVCEAPVGWCSTGTFTDFYTDDSDTLDLCVDCYESRDEDK
jgi:hypothetical protein